MTKSVEKPYLVATFGSDSGKVFKKELRKYFLELITQGISVFAFFALPLFVTVVTLTKSLLKIESWLLISLGGAGLTGLAAVAFCQIILIKQFAGTIKDIKNQRTAQVQLVAKQAISVLLTDSGLETLVLDCGEKTLVLIGGWWRKSSYRQLVQEAAVTDFPTNIMTITYLPSSGRVLSITANGDALKVRFANSMSPPVLQIKIDRGLELKIFDTVVGELLDFKKPR